MKHKDSFILQIQHHDCKSHGDAKMQQIGSGSIADIGIRIKGLPISKASPDEPRECGDGKIIGTRPGMFLGMSISTVGEKRPSSVVIGAGSRVTNNESVTWWFRGKVIYKF